MVPMGPMLLLSVVVALFLEFVACWSCWQSEQTSGKKSEQKSEQKKMARHRDSHQCSSTRPARSDRSVVC